MVTLNRVFKAPTERPENGITFPYFIKHGSEVAVYPKISDTLLNTFSIDNTSTTFSCILSHIRKQHLYVRALSDSK